MTSANPGREWANPAVERALTWPNLVTGLRTLGCGALGAMGALEQSLHLLIWALVVYWLGDMADGALARALKRETRIGAVLDIVCDRACAAVFYLGLIWLIPDLTLPVMVYLTEFMILDMVLSLAFLAWPVSSPNYFHVVDRKIWLWNWSKPAKALNSALFAVLLIWTRDVWLCTAIAAALLVLKLVSLRWLFQIGLPIPSRVDGHGTCGADKVR